MKKTKEVPERLKWFASQIGKNIFRPKNDCRCITCDDVYERGVRVRDKDHAYALYSYEAEVGVKYFPTIEERNLFEVKKLRS